MIFIFFGYFIATDSITKYMYIIENEKWDVEFNNLQN